MSNGGLTTTTNKSKYLSKDSVANTQIYLDDNHTRRQNEERSLFGMQ